MTTAIAMTMKAISSEVFRRAWISSEVSVLSYQVRLHFGTGNVK
jgi:hypothetical protein